MLVFRLALGAIFLVVSLGAQIPDTLDAQLKRIFEAKDLTAKSLKPLRWIDEGAAYTVIEPDGDGQSLVRYNTASGERTVLLPATYLKPPWRRNRSRSTTTNGRPTISGC